MGIVDIEAHEILTKYFTIFTHTLLRDHGFNSYVMYCTVLYCTELYCTVPYCTVLYTLLYSSTQKLLLSRSIYVAIHSNNNFLGFITLNFLEFRSRGEQRRLWREMIIFADKHTDNQTKSNSKAEAPFSTVVCGYSGRGPITTPEKNVFPLTFTPS